HRRHRDTLPVILPWPPPLLPPPFDFSLDPSLRSILHHVQCPPIPRQHNLPFHTFPIPPPTTRVPKIPIPYPYPLQPLPHSLLVPNKLYPPSLSTRHHHITQRQPASSQRLPHPPRRLTIRNKQS